MAVQSEAQAKRPLTGKRAKTSAAACISEAGPQKPASSKMSIKQTDCTEPGCPRTQLSKARLRKPSRKHALESKGRSPQGLFTTLTTICAFSNDHILHTKPQKPQRLETDRLARGEHYTCTIHPRRKQPCLIVQTTSFLKTKRPNAACVAECSLMRTEQHWIRQWSQMILNSVVWYTAGPDTAQH
jgi:hypothetical protein